MTAADLIDQIDVLGLTLADLAAMTGQSDEWCISVATGREEIPTWLNLLVATWATYPETVELARVIVDTARVDVD